LSVSQRPEALTAAEYLAFEKDMHVLVIITDTQTTLRPFVRFQPPARKFRAGAGYPGYLYTDLATLYERAGRILESKTYKFIFEPLPLLQGQLQRHSIHNILRTHFSFM
jgi:vacuolar-type H+-ATPase subunit B/Vma2